jgi:hypothetical protein
MANDINSGATLEKPKKSRQKQSKDPDKWTFGRSVLFLLITFDLIAVLAWLIYYHPYYENISKIVGGVWAAVLTFLSYMKIKRGRKRSLVEFLQILPVKMVIITYTVLIFLLASIFVFAEFPVHAIHITAYLNDNPQSGALISLDSKQYRTEEDGTYEIHSVKAGDYTLSGSFASYVSEKVTVSVHWWQLKNHQKLIIPTPPLPGKIDISSQFRGEDVNGADICIDGKKQDKQTPAILRNFSEGEHSIKLTKVIDDFPCRAKRNVTVEAGKTTVVKMELIPDPMGNIRIISNFRGRPLNGAEIFIDAEEQNRQTPATLKKVPSGQHSIKLFKTYDDYCYEAEKEINVEAAKTSVAEMGLKLVGKLCKLEIRSNPTGASIYINEKSHGTTNATVKLCPGIYKIRLEKSGYETTYREVIIKEPINSITISLSIE